METIDRTCTRTENGQKVAYPAPFTSGMVQTRDDKGNVKYAAQGDFYAEARIQLPAGPSSWASFWFTGTTGGPWPGNGEIDVVEAKGYDPNYLQANTHTPRASDPSKSEQHQGQLGGDGTSQTRFHVYGVEKTGEKITFYLDGVPRHTVNYSDIGGANPFVVDGNGMVIRLNHMVGGSFLATNSGDTTYVDATPYADSYMGAGSDMLVDYVRVYSKKPTVEEPEAPVVPTPEPTAPVEPALPTDPKPADPTPAEPAPAEPTPAAPAPETPAPAEPTPADPTPAPVEPSPATPTPAVPETPATPPTDDTVTPAPAPAPATPSPETPAPETPAPAPTPTEQPTPESPAPAVETPAPSATTPAPTVEPAAPANPTDGATPGTDGVHGAGPSTSTPGTNGAAIGGVLPAGTAPTVTATTRGGDAALAKTGADTRCTLLGRSHTHRTSMTSRRASMRRTQAPMSASRIEQGPYGIETGLYERLATTYVSAPEAACIPLGRSAGGRYLMKLVLTRRPRRPGRAFSTTMAGMVTPRLRAQYRMSAGVREVARSSRPSTSDLRVLLSLPATK